MFRCSIAAANTDKLQFKFKFYSYVMRNCVDDKNDNNAQKGGPHLNICLGAPDSLVTPLYLSPVLHPLASRGTAVAPTGWDTPSNYSAFRAFHCDIFSYRLR